MEEELKNKIDENEEGSIIRSILVIAKRNILFIILLVILSAGIGAIVAYLKKPVYTATNVVTFTATSNNNEQVSITSNNDFMHLNYQSVIRFCGSDVVADRADFYYANLLKERNTNAELSVNEYVKALDIYEKVRIKRESGDAFATYSYDEYFKDKILSSKGYTDLYGEDDSHFTEYVNNLISQDLSVSYGDFRYYMAAKKRNNALTLGEYMATFKTLDGTYFDASKVEKTDYIDVKKISTVAGTTATNSYINYFTIRYKDGNWLAASDKLTLIDFAASIEINEGFNNGTTTEEYFNGITITIKPSEDPQLASDTSKIRIILIATAIGLVLSVALVYLKQILDNTVKDKTILEKITGTTVLAYIVDREKE